MMAAPWVQEQLIPKTLLQQPGHYSARPLPQHPVTAQPSRLWANKQACPRPSCDRRGDRARLTAGPG